MKFWNGLLRILFDAVLIMCGMLAAVCAVPTAFMIPFSRATLILGSAIAALLLSGWMHLPRVGIAPGIALLGGTVAFAVIRREMVKFGARWALYMVVDPLSRDFAMLPSVAAPNLPNGADFTYISASVTAALLIASAVFGLLLAFALIRGRMALLSVLVPLPPFLLSLIYTDQPPALWTAILLTVYCGGALLGQGLRKHESKRLGGFLTLLVPLLAVFALLLLAFSPQKDFTPIPFEERQEMLGDRVESIGDALLSLIRNNPKDYDLYRQGDRKEDQTKAFSIKASKAGTYLMRSHSYGQYRKGVWQEAEDYDAWSSMKALGNHGNGSTTLITVRDAISGERYVPYAFTQSDSLTIGESFVRSASKTGYQWRIYDAVNLELGSVSNDERAYLAFAQEQYTMPDGEQKDALLRIANAAGLSVQRDAYQTARMVASYVQRSGTYSLTPPKVPSDRDFVEYFLTESHVGYCVHFASATTALLQAMNVPARYTVGYRAIVPTSETWTDVTEQVAHAWAEVYLAGVGWVPIESTAGFSYDLQNTQTPQQQPSTPVPTAIPAETPTDEPTAEPTEEPTEAPTPEPTPTEVTEETQAPGTSEKPSASPAPTDTPQSGDGPSIIGEPNEPSAPQKHSGAWWLLLLLIPVLCAAWYGFGMLVRKRREASFRRSNRRKAVLAMLGYLKRLERYGVNPDPRAEEWAEEAAYSDHPMTEEHRILLGKIKKVQSTLYREKPLLRFFVKWILIAI